MKGGLKNILGMIFFLSSSSKCGRMEKKKSWVAFKLVSSKACKLRALLTSQQGSTHKDELPVSSNMVHLMRINAVYHL